MESFDEARDCRLSFPALPPFAPRYDRQRQSGLTGRCRLSEKTLLHGLSTKNSWLGRMNKKRTRIAAIVAILCSEVWLALVELDIICSPDAVVDYGAVAAFVLLVFSLVCTIRADMRRLEKVLWAVVTVPLGVIMGFAASFLILARFGLVDID